MTHNPNRVFSIPPIYNYSLDKAMVITTLKQGTTYLSNIICGNLRPRYIVDLLNMEIIDHPQNVAGDWRKPDGVTEGDIGRWKQSTLVDMELVMKGENIKKTIFLIRNPIKRIVASIIQDTLKTDTFLTEESKKEIETIYKIEGFKIPELEVRGDLLWFHNPHVTETQKSILFEYIISKWIQMVEGRRGPAAHHLIPQWESFVYAFINNPSVKKEKIKIIDVDEKNINDIIKENTVSKKLKDEPKKIHSTPDGLKEEFENHIKNNSKYKKRLNKIIEVDLWFYQLLTNKKKHEW